MPDVSREGWGARSPKHVTPLDAGRTKGVGGHYNGPPLKITDHDQCFEVMRNTQRYHMDTKGWADYAYTGAACPHGVTFEGRGWGARTAANGTNYGNANYHAIKCLLGDGEEPTSEMLAAFNRLLAEKPAGGLEVRPHRVFKPTLCPGDPLTEWINGGRPVELTLGSRALRQGMSGSDVRSWQQRMRDYYGGTKPAVDGRFGPETHAYTLETQKRAGVTVDGIVGPQTLRGMARLEAAKKAAQVPAETPARLLRIGVEGEDVRAWQQRMRDYYGGTRPAVDGRFGPETFAFTQETQKRAGVIIDGVVGPKTLEGMARLEAAKAKPPPPPSPPPIQRANAVVFDPDAPATDRLVEERLARAVGAYQVWPVYRVGEVEGVRIAHIYAVGRAHRSGEGLAVDGYTQLAGTDLSGTVDAVLGWMADNRPSS